LCGWVLFDNESEVLVAHADHKKIKRTICHSPATQANSPDVMMAFNTEALKLAAIGATVLVSTGDDGVAGSEDRCDMGSSSAISDWVVSSCIHSSATSKYIFMFLFLFLSLLLRRGSHGLVRVTFPLSLPPPRM
jgi:hypothetical protein